MGKSNIAVKQWLRDKRRFADLFNGTVFQGQQIVLPEDLEEIDSESSMIVTCKNHQEKGVQKYRDIAMRWKREAELAILALSKFRKEDKIYPVIPLVFYYGLTPWDASKDLYGMFHQENEVISHELWKQYIPNYKLNLIDVGNVDEVEKFQSDFHLIFGMLKYRNQKSGIQEYVENHREYFSNVDIETYQAIRELLHSEKQLKNVREGKNGKERIDMCTAIETIYNNGLNEGIKAMILTCCDLGLSKEDILERIMKNSSMTLDAAKSLVEQYVK